jgi:hypothetical protein
LSTNTSATANTHARWATSGHAVVQAPRLNELAAYSSERLAELFAAAGVPESLAGLEGDPVCRGIIRGGRLARRWARSTSCPWIGKSFETIAPGELRGHNRLRAFGARRVLSFTAAVAPSVHDGHPAIVLRYDDPRARSPWWTHAIHDELREVAPGLLAGPAGMRLRGGKVLTLCWFAIDMTADRTTRSTARDREATVS